MNRIRWLILVLAPAPIIAGSVALSRYARSGIPNELALNHVVAPLAAEGEAKVDANVALAAYDAATPPSSPATEKSAAKLAAACAAQGEAIGEKLGEKCRVLVKPPFVIAGDLSDKQLAQWHEQTIAPAAEAMWARYFAARPDHPVTVLLFGSKESYEHYAAALYRDRGISVYGYYKPRERTLVMNIATGGGTLVHELTHALVAFDCPEVPAWFNEGLASLHEQCRFREDKHGPWIEGLVNWRLPRLQAEIKAERLPSLRDFVRDDDFRGDREGINYAQARYFCLFMQRRGVLEAYYAQLKKTIDADPQGEKAIEVVFPKHTWTELDAEFQAFARDLQ